MQIIYFFSLLSYNKCFIFNRIRRSFCPEKKKKNPYSAIGLSVPLKEEAGAIPDDHPLQMGRHDEPAKAERVSGKTQ